jgi:glycine betaine catabolism B
VSGSYGSKLLEKIPRVADVASFRFKRPEAYRFQAGQWFVISFSGSDPQEPWEHHFSHSDAPTESWLEFTTRMRGTDFKNALDALPPGSQVEIEGPFGSFVWPDGVERAAFLAGGIGITCVRSILKWLCDTCGAGAVEAERPQTPPREIVLFYANRSGDAIPFNDELEEIAARLPALRIVHVLSQPGDAWQGHRGHLDQNVLASELSGGHVGWQFFVSGPPSFDTAMRDMLLGWGVDDPRIKTEAFLGY